ncbi:DUF4173 domain-containing protein [Actinoplanes bogorensis]|uniref:DUF4173 domain-containing protein n=1 Tax=Paractinoplanes bogorensis TaxID=1610840 RepID=A0ABS5YKB6_9ACTN|nr:DUF4173 domain-containing protein [Actinoplanes bogorensis]MBU2663486.1 DUF4173 domain-containing protein [Actinoplanes bogorensis]
MSIAPAQKQVFPPLHGPWPATAPWGRQWIGPGRPASIVTVASVAGAAAIAALSLPLDRAGVGWLVTAIAAMAAVFIADVAKTRGPQPLVTHRRGNVRTEQLAWALATVALLAVGTFRSAGWLYALCVVVATLTAALALAGGRSMRSIFVAYTMPYIAAFRAVPWLARGLPRKGNVRILTTALVSAVLLLAFGSLLASADARFATALERLVPDLGVDTVFRWIFLGGFTAMAVGGAAFLRVAPPDLSKLDRTEGRKVHRWEWAVPLSLLTALFAAFVAVQMINTEMQGYASEARSGFWQLSWVVGLTLLVLAGAARWAPRQGRTDRLLIRIVLGALTALTLVIAATAIQRIVLYTNEYGLTRLRLLVFCCELWFVFVLLLVLIAGRRIRAPWLPRVAIAAGVGALIALAVANPDGMIAERNAQPNGDRPIDLSYLGDLSPDAVPALTKADGLTEEQLLCVLGRLNTGLVTTSDDWRSWSLGRQQARVLIATHGNPTFDCTPLTSGR